LDNKNAPPGWRGVSGELSGKLSGELVPGFGSGILPQAFLRVAASRASARLRRE